MLDRLGFHIQVRIDYEHKEYLFMILINFILIHYISIYTKREPGERSYGIAQGDVGWGGVKWGCGNIATVP